MRGANMFNFGTDLHRFYLVSKSKIWLGFTPLLSCDFIINFLTTAKLQSLTKLTFKSKWAILDSFTVHYLVILKAAALLVLNDNVTFVLLGVGSLCPPQLTSF